MPVERDNLTVATKGGIIAPRVKKQKSRIIGGSQAWRDFRAGRITADGYVKAVKQEAREIAQRESERVPA